jgi:hypothetical protein
MPARTSVCHCRMCQKAVGQPFAAYSAVPLDKFNWTRGNPPTFRSSSAAERHFCPHCGTSLTFRYFHKQEIDVAVGTLDHPERVRPVAEVGIESRVPWVPVLDVPQEPTGGDNPSEVLRTLKNFQHPDHDTPDGWAPPHA